MRSGFFHTVLSFFCRAAFAATMAAGRIDHKIAEFLFYQKRNDAFANGWDGPAP
jgi:hypothetical protein